MDLGIKIKQMWRNNAPFAVELAAVKSVKREDLRKLKLRFELDPLSVFFLLSTYTNIHSVYNNFQDLVVYRGEGEFDKNQQLLYMTHLLLPLLEQINQEKDIEMDIEAKIKGKMILFFLIFTSSNWKQQSYLIFFS